MKEVIEVLNDARWIPLVLACVFATLSLSIHVVYYILLWVNKFYG